MRPTADPSKGLRIFVLTLVALTVGSAVGFAAYSGWYFKKSSVVGWLALFQAGRLLVESICLLGLIGSRRWALNVTGLLVSSCAIMLAVALAGSSPLPTLIGNITCYGPVVYLTAPAVRARRSNEDPAGQ